MRTIIELPPDQLAGLEALCAREGISRAEAIRRAVGALLAREQSSKGTAFGLWRGANVSGIDYQERVRSEWGARDPMRKRG
jgi:hypothetical protein